MAIMKGNRTIVFLSTFTAFVILVTSCAKRQSPETPFTKIQGKWKLIQQATDDNANGQIDGSEIESVPALMDNEKQFNKDGTGVETNVYNGVTTPPLNFTWKIVGQDSVWIAYAVHDTTTFYVSTVSASNLTLTTMGQHGLAWYYYSKK
jgi:hypothetical protein